MGKLSRYENFVNFTTDYRYNCECVVTLIVVSCSLACGQPWFKMSGILKYFKQSKEVVITPKVKEMAVKEGKKVEDAAAEAAKAGMKREHYDFLSDDNKAKVAKYTLEYGVTLSL